MPTRKHNALTYKYLYTYISILRKCVCVGLYNIFIDMHLFGLFSHFSLFVKHFMLDSWFAAIPTLTTQTHTHIPMFVHIHIHVLIVYTYVWVRFLIFSSLMPQQFCTFFLFSHHSSCIPRIGNSSLH